jgi:penicillin-binding protein 2
MKGKRRAQRLLVLVLAAFGLLAIRLFDLQKLNYAGYAEIARENQLQRERVISPRGLIKDRNGVVLVDNVPRFDIVVRWHDDADVRDNVADLGAYLPLDTANVFLRFDSWKKRNAGLPFPIIENADKFSISFVRENNDLFPDLRVETKARRRYRRGAFAAHLLGYVGEVNDKFLSLTRAKTYYPGDMVGKTGIEMVCEQYLTGWDGQRVVAVNASGTSLGEIPELLQPPEPGKDVVLTIDARLQECLEKLIAPQGAGAAVVIDVRDGALLAVVSVPQFDPNSFSIGITQADWDRLSEAKNKPLFNRFLQATYPPGSTLKIISTYAILSNHLIDPNKILVYCTGSHRFGNRIYKCWKSWGHGYMNLHDAFVQSCDSYFYEVGEIMDVDMLAAAAREFGLGSRTGIDLPNEITGLVPDRTYYDERFGRGQWTQGLMLNDIIGQGEFLSSVLQLGRVAAAIGNGGYLVQPHVIKEITGEVAGVYPKRRIRNLSGSTLSFLQRAMEGVVQDEEGTARGSRVPGIRAAGKTGTAQNPHGQDHAWFVGYAPVRDPEIAIALIIENAGHGGAIAAPIAGQFYREYFRPDTSTAIVSRSAAVVGTRRMEVER